MTTQVQTLHDVNTCSRCGSKGKVEVLEGQKTSKWQCGTCNLIQEWRPSKNFKLATA